MLFKGSCFPIAQPAQLGNGPLSSLPFSACPFSVCLQLLPPPWCPAEEGGDQGARPSNGLILLLSGVGAHVGSHPKAGSLSRAVLLWGVGTLLPWTSDSSEPPSSSHSLSGSPLTVCSSQPLATGSPHSGRHVLGQVTLAQRSSPSWPQKNRATFPTELWRRRLGQPQPLTSHLQTCSAREVGCQSLWPNCWDKGRSLGLASALAAGRESTLIVLPSGRGATSWPSPPLLRAAPLSQGLGSLHVQADGEQ